MLFDNLDNLSKAIELTNPVPMEKLNQGYGYILYKSSVKGPREEQEVRLQYVHDRGYIYKDRELLGIQYRNDKENKVRTSFDKEGNELAVIVENMGRVNYGAHLKDSKGITYGIGLGNNFIFHWQAYPLPFDNIEKTAFRKEVSKFNGEPVILKAEIDIDECHDTFIKLPGFKKGIIILNGKVLSRYWEKGPQKSAYIPGPFLKKGKNEIAIVEFEGYEAPEFILDDKEDIG